LPHLRVGWSRKQGCDGAENGRERHIMSANEESDSSMSCGCQIHCPVHAAAPKLLTALEELLPWIERGKERFDREQARVLTQAIGAIREAKGER
jgi:hypothetical protein